MTTTDDVLKQIRAHGAEAYPEEGCGFLLGRMDDGATRVTRMHRAGNERAENRARRFTLSPEAYRAAEAAAAERGLDVVGFYHSHPDHPARPSATDLAEASFPGYAYVIVSIRDGTPADLTAWQLAPDRSRFTEDDIALAETPA